MNVRSGTTNIDAAAEPFDISALLGDDASSSTEHVFNPDGSVEIELEPDPAEDIAFDANLAEHMDEKELTALSSELIELVEADIFSRKDWVDVFVKGLEVLGMKYEERTEPWSGACGVFSTVLTEAAIRFQSEMITETFPAAGPVKTLIQGASDRKKEDAAERVRDDMNYQLTEVMVEYRPEHERLLFSLGLAGAAFKKVYKDNALGRQTAVFVPAEDIIIPYGASNVYNAERVTHVMRKTPNEVKKLQVSGFYREMDLGDPVHIFSDVEKKKAEEQGYSLTDDDRFQFFEIHVDYDLPGYEDPDGIALPYVITIERGTKNVLAIRRNWAEDDDTKKLKRQHFVSYIYIPGFGPYGIGLIHLIGGYAKAGTSIIRQLVDAGTLSNLPGGLKTKGLRIKGDDTPIAPGEFRDVDIPSGTVRDNIMTLPYKEPSQVLAALLERITDEARRLASISDMNISDMSAQAPVGTTLAILERTLKTMSAVQARAHASLRMEFKLLKAIISEDIPTEYDYDVENTDRKAKQSDYDMVEVIPVSDPNASTMAQRIMQYQAAVQLSASAPQIYDLPYLHRQMIEVLGLKNADKIVPIEEDQNPRDPISENMGFLTSKPTKAFIYQDHDAHIACHMALMQDPMIMQMIGQSPMGQQMGAAVMGHISEHLAFSYRAKVEQQLGVQMPAPNAELPPDVEVQLSRLVAQAAQQLLQSNVQQAQQQAAQQQAQQAMQNPELQAKMAEIRIKEADSQRKDGDSLRDYEIATKRLQLEEKRMQLDLVKENARLKVQVNQHAMANKSKEKMHGHKVKADVLKHFTQPRNDKSAPTTPVPSPKGTE